MAITDTIAQIERDIAHTRERIQTDSALLRGLEVQLATLNSGASPAGDLTAIGRSDAILAVLRQANGTMSPTEIVNQLHAAGRDDHLREVTATPDHLRKTNRVTRPDRGRYLAVA